MGAPSLPIALCANVLQLSNNPYARAHVQETGHKHTHTHKTYLLNTGRELSWGEETKELSNKVCILVVGNGQHILPVRVIYHRAKPLLAGKVTFMTIPSASRARNRQPRITRHLRKAVIKTERETDTVPCTHTPG